MRRAVLMLAFALALPASGCETWRAIVGPDVSPAPSAAAPASDYERLHGELDRLDELFDQGWNLAASMAELLPEGSANRARAKAALAEANRRWNEIHGAAVVALELYQEGNGHLADAEALAGRARALLGDLGYR